MTDVHIYQALADAFAAEGVDALFTLLGDGNMHWSAALTSKPGVRTYHVRHEHNTVMMAMGYASATGRTAVASVTCGPGVTQLTTALATAVRNRMPIVVYAGETPLDARFHNQAIEQQPIVAAAGARYIAAHSPIRMHEYVREAFYTARHERLPVVLGVPYDLQARAMPAIGPYVPSSTLIPDLEPIPPDPGKTARLVDKLLEAERPIIVAGRGVLAAGAADPVEALAERCGALLATTLPARGLYDHNPFSLGVCGGFAREVAREQLGQADFVLVFGASLNSFTLDGGRIFPQATVGHIDARPEGMRDGLRGADLHLRADAALAARMMLELAGNRSSRAVVRNDELARRIREAPADSTVYEIESGALDPRAVFGRLEKVIPRSYEMVSGTGHQGYFHTTMRGTNPDRYHVHRAFGAVGNSLGLALGVAAARSDGSVVLFDGDGGLMMHIQELETAYRHGIKLLIICSNDGGYGAEIHKLRADSLDETIAIFGRPDFAAIAHGFGLDGATVTDLDQFGELLENYERGTSTMIWDVHVSNRVVSPSMRVFSKTGR